MNPESCVAFLFPGQGSQQEGMLHSLLEYRSGRDTIREARQHLGFDPLQFDNAEALHSTRNVQLALLISGIATLRELDNLGAHPEMVAGLSVGAFGAAHAATGLAFKTALDLVSLRGALMEESFPARYGMAFIIGLSERRVLSLLDEVNRQHPSVYLAGVNSPSQIVASGTETGLDSLVAAARKAGAAKANRLNVAVPSHCELLRPAAERLSTAAAGVTIPAPRIPYIDNRGGRLARDAETIRTDLATNMAYPIHWHDATTVLFELGARLFVEMPPGDVLTRLAAAAFPEARAVACSSTKLENIATLVRRYKAR